MTKADIDRLIENQESENTELDYKAAISLGPDSDRIEFLADIASFANSAGGYIVLGVTELRDDDGKATGLPEKAVGLSGNMDQAIRTMQDLILSGIQPRVSVGIGTVPGFEQGPVVVIRIPRSAAAPHMVTLRGVSRFYGRAFAQKFMMDVSQIRSAFLQQFDESDVRRTYRFDRVNRLVQGDGAVPYKPRNGAVVHVIPRGALEGRVSIDTQALYRATQPYLPPLMDTGFNVAIGFDGVIHDDGESSGYTLIGRNGIAEGVGEVLWNGQLLIQYLEKKVVDWVLLTTLGLGKLGAEPPYAVALSLFGVKGAEPALDGFRIRTQTHPPLSDVLFYPEIEIGSSGLTEAEIAELLKPCFDHYAQTVGISRSLSYDANGLWKPGR